MSFLFSFLMIIYFSFPHTLPDPTSFSSLGLMRSKTPDWGQGECGHYEWDYNIQDKVRKTMYHIPFDDNTMTLSIDDLLKDCCQFSDSKDFYRLRGIPFRRSHLIAGPAQCGKMYLVRYIAGCLGRRISVIDFAQPSSRLLTDAGLSALVQQCDHKDILVLRNIDAAVSASAGGAGRSTGDDDEGDGRGTQDRAKYTYSGILNILDGPRASMKGVITFVTTRRYQKLLQDRKTADALLRPGRCEKRVHLDTPTAFQVKALFSKMFTEIDDDEIQLREYENQAEDFVKTCRDLEREYEDRKRRERREGRGEDDAFTSSSLSDFWRTFAGWEEIQNYFKDHHRVDMERKKTNGSSDVMEEDMERKTNGLSDVVKEDHVKKFLRDSQSARRHTMFELTKKQLTKVRRGHQLSLESTSGQEKVKDIVLDSHYVLGQVFSLATNITTLDELLDSDWCTALDKKLHKKVTVLRTNTRELENLMVLSAFDETSVDRMFSSSSVERKEEHPDVEEVALCEIFRETSIPPASFDRMFEEMFKEEKEQLLSTTVVSKVRFKSWLESLEGMAEIEGKKGEKKSD